MSAQQLTISVKDTEGKPYADTTVSIDETEISGTTDANGNVTLNLPEGRSTITLTVKHGEDTVQTPFYITEGGSRNLSIDFPYLQQQIQMQAAENVPPSVPVQSPRTPSPTLLIGIVVIIVVAILAFRYRQVLMENYLQKILKRRKRQEKPQLTWKSHDPY